MLTYKTTLACAFALIGSVSAGLLPTNNVVSDIVSSVAASEVVPTDVVPAIISSVSAQAQKSAPTDVISAIVSSVSAEDPIPTDVVSAVVNSAISSGGKPFPTDVFPAFTQLTQLSCMFGGSLSVSLKPGFGLPVTVSPASNGVEVPVARKLKLYLGSLRLLADRYNLSRICICSIAHYVVGS